MRNLWVQTEAEQVAWWADLVTIPRPEDVLALVLRAATLARDFAVAQFDLAAVADHLHRVWVQDGAVDLRLTRHPAPATLAWYDRDGTIVEGDVVDPGALLRSTSPEPRSHWSRHTSSWCALQISGSLLRFRSHTGAPTSPRVANLGFVTYTDIWFPFVVGVAHPACDAKRYFDNRDLANRHTPRLNRFLSEMAETVVAAGGRWELDQDVVSTALKPWVTERGIRLDGPVPPLMPPELVDVPWPALDDA